MRRYLIVSNRTLGGHHLIAHIQRALDRAVSAFHVIVPVDPDASDDEAMAARRRLDDQLARVADLGGSATGAIVRADPYDATLGALQRLDADEVIVCTLPPGLSRWLGLDLVGRLKRAVDQPITHIVAPAGMAERITATAVRLTIIIGESDHHGHTPLHSEIVQRARAAGLAGATVLRGVEGFGAASIIHTSRLLSMSEDLPMVIVIVDTPERIDRFLPELDDLITGGLVVRESVDIVKYEAGGS